ncbi:Dyp-type peroxidase [Streptomyces sp. NPDC047980]|uniref:Dyp-type peroxidase n=1 Tax=Streptomyces sp. NPDC047980 TaxID=3365494 RepID=UPI00371B3AE3
MGEAAAGGGGEATVAVGDLLVVAARVGALSDVAIRLGPVVDGHLVQVDREQAGVHDGGEPGGGSGAVLVLAAGERAEKFDQGVSRSRHPAFAGDLLDPQQTGGDVLIELSGHKAADVRAYGKALIAAVSEWRLRWQLEGHRPSSRVDDRQGLARNPFHFTEGFGNPSTEREVTERIVVRGDQGEPAWAVGGSYQVVRIVRLATELWDKDSAREQERITGRRRDGRWLDGTPAGEQPNSAADPEGRLTPLDSHVRLAAPDRRNPPPIVRRSYTYDRGNGDRGLIFSCFQRDLAEGVEYGAYGRVRRRFRSRLQHGDDGLRLAALTQGLCQRHVDARVQSGFRLRAQDS